MGKYKLTDIKRYDKDREGNPLKTKDGRNYTRLVIQVDKPELAGQNISGFENWKSKEWKVSDEVEIEIEKKGDYWNFRTPNKEDKVAERLEQIQNKLTKLELMIIKIGQAVVLQPKDDYPESTPENTPDFDPKEDEPPF